MTYQQFNRSIERIFENVQGSVDINEIIEEYNYPCASIIPNRLLKEIYKESAKLNNLGILEQIPTDKIIRLLIILEKNIRIGAKVCNHVTDAKEGEQCMEVTITTVMNAAYASLIALYILTAQNMNKQIYIEKLIDTIIDFTKIQLENIIYPAFDHKYRLQIKNKSGTYVGFKKLNINIEYVSDKNILNLYKKLTEVVSLLGEMINVQSLTDISILNASNIGISTLNIEKIGDLQLVALKLVTNIFRKYEHHRLLLIDDVLNSLTRLPSGKHNLRLYKLHSEEYIQILTALILQFLQSISVLSQNLIKSHDDIDTIISKKIETSKIIATKFLYGFLIKCNGKSEEIDGKLFFENFLKDLLITVYKPEWPAAELLLNVLGNLLVNNLMNKSLEISLRSNCLDYLGMIAVHLRKDTVISQSKKTTIDQIISEIQLGEYKENVEMIGSDISETGDEKRIKFLHNIILHYLTMRSETDPLLENTRHFYLIQWYQDCCNKISSIALQKNEERGKKKLLKRKQNLKSNRSSSTADRMETYKQLLLSNIGSFKDTDSSKKTKKPQAYVEYSSIALIVKYLASERPFSRRFDMYLKHILKLLREPTTVIRTKAMKCLTSIVEVDPEVLSLKEMQIYIRHSFFDHSVSVREAAVDLVGKFILGRPDLITTYYDLISARILDTGVSVRKKVIKILKDICAEYPNFDKIPDIYVKIIKRIQDEDSIRKIVLELFQSMWFTPVNEEPVFDTEAIERKVMTITDVIEVANEVSMKWFEQLLTNIYEPKEENEVEIAEKTALKISNSVLLATKQIIDCLVLRVNAERNNSQRLVSYLTILHSFAKFRPQLIVHHAATLQSYLSLKSQTFYNLQVIIFVFKILELIVPLIEHPSEILLSNLEDDSVKIMIQQNNPSVVLSCVSCLGTIVNCITKNYKLIRECLQKYLSFLLAYRQKLEKQVNNNISELIEKLYPSFRRSIFIVGLLFRYFDFNDKEIIGDLSKTIKDDVFNLLIYFLKNEKDSKHYTLKAIGSFCTRHCELMLDKELKTFYHKYLTNEEVSVQIKVQVLNNIENYLQEEEGNLTKQNKEWTKISKNVNLKEMYDVKSGISSTIIQLYLKEILQAYLDSQVGVRISTVRVIQLILSQGLVHPVETVSYLICMSTDEEMIIRNSAIKLLKDIEQKYPGFIHMRAQNGVQLSYNLQRIIQSKNNDLIRGFRAENENTQIMALNGFLYSILHKKQRRALLLSILKQFEDQSKKISLTQLLYLADNLAYFPYQVLDEPLFVIYHTDIIISIIGGNLLQSFEDALIPIHNGKKKRQVKMIEENNNDEDDSYEENEDTFLSRIPEDTQVLQHYLTASKGCLILLALKKHLKTLFDINDSKIAQYSPTKCGKIFEKTVKRNRNIIFKGEVIIKHHPSQVLDEEAKRSLVSEYLEFKKLLMNLDPDCEISKTLNNVKQNSTNGNASSMKEDIEVIEQLPKVQKLNKTDKDVRTRCSLSRKKSTKKSNA